MCGKWRDWIQWQGYNLGILTLAFAIGWVVYALLMSVDMVGGALSRFEQMPGDWILSILPEHDRVIEWSGVAAGMMLAIGGFARRTDPRLFVRLLPGSLGLLALLCGLVALLLPHYHHISTLNGGDASDGWTFSKDGSRWDDVVWAFVAFAGIVLSLYFKITKCHLRRVSSRVRPVIACLLVLAVMGVSWAMLTTLAASEVLLDNGLGGQRLPYLTEGALRVTPESVRVRLAMVFGTGFVAGLSLMKPSKEKYPRGYSMVLLMIFLCACLVLMFLVIPYYQAYAVVYGSR